MSFDNRVVLITGAAVGIGRETACAFAREKAFVIVNYSKSEDEAAETMAQVRALGGDGMLARADVSSEADVKLMFDSVGPVRGGNNAAVALIAPLLRLSVEDWDTTMAVNLRAPFLIARELAPQMIARKAGKIINVSSQAGIIAVDDHGAYSSSKGGLNMLPKAMTVEWAKHNIQINSVCPTVILTPMGEKNWGSPEKSGPMLAKIPAGCFGKPVEVADMILYLASSASDLVCGQDILIDGGYTAL